MTPFTSSKNLVLCLIACVVAGGAAVAGLPPSQSVVAARGLTLQIDAMGRISGGTVGEGKLPMVVSGGSALEGFTTVGTAAVQSRAGGGCEITRRMEDARKRVCRVTDRFTPAESSIRWEMEVVSDARKPWTAPLELVLKTEAKPSSRFWTAWVNGTVSSNNSISDGTNWGDPLAPMALMDRTWKYGNGRGSICIPIASVLEPKSDTGLSLVLSPEQPLLLAELSNNPDGTFLFRHKLLRLGGGKRVKLTADIVAHEADWRGGLRWMVGRYPDYFNPPNPKADEMAGCGAYSHNQGEWDVARLKKMGFRVNWNASFEWPWFGMFLPPAPSWKSAGQDVNGDSVPALVKDESYQSMNDYCRRMREDGFFALNYFNISVFGSQVRAPSLINKELAPADWWTDATTFLYRTMPHSVVMDRPGHVSLEHWSHAVHIDCADAQAQRELIGQARRNIEVLPDSPGICIDNMNVVAWTNFAPGADDKVGWYGDGRPGRFLALSWIDTLSKIGPIMHKNGRVIFGNSCFTSHRLDLFRELDGIFDESGHLGYAFNGSSMIALRKTAVMWTLDTQTLQADPDSFFQRHLYMGAYPMAPVPGNDHSILPKAKLDQWYLDYGPLLDVMRGKKWVLQPHCVETTTPGVKVNLFQVPGGYALPVTFGGTAESATVHLRNLDGLAKLRCEALHPGAETATPVPATLKDGVLELTIPLKRGCAMVRIVPS